MNILTYFSSFETDLSKALVGLKNKSDHLVKVADYFDSAYKVSAGRNLGDTSTVGGIQNEGTENVEKQVKLYILDALDTVANDICHISDKLVGDLSEKTRDANNLALQIGLLKTDVDLAKNYFMLQKFTAIKSGGGSRDAPKKNVLKYFERAETDELYHEDYAKKETLRSVSTVVRKLEGMGLCLYQSDKRGVSFGGKGITEDDLVADMGNLNVQSDLPTTEGKNKWKPKFLQRQSHK